MRNSLETSIELLGESLHLRVEYDYVRDDVISLVDVEMFRPARECALYWSWESFERVNLTNIISYAQQDAIKGKIISQEANIKQWTLESSNA